MLCCDRPKSPAPSPNCAAHFSERSLVPDIAVLTWAQIPRDPDGSVANLVNTAPDWAIEILSPNQRQSRVTQKLLACLESGTQMGWLIDPDDLSVLVYMPDARPQFFDQLADRLPVPDFAADLQLSLQDLWDCLQG